MYLVTESVEPLQLHLNDLNENTVDDKSKQQKDLFIAWGLFQVTVSGLKHAVVVPSPFNCLFIQRALAFLNNDGNLQHNSVGLGSIFVNSAGEWKLGGLEYTGAPTLTNPLPIKILPGLEKYDPPEKSDTSKLRHSTKW